MTEKKTQSKAGKEDNKKERSSMAKVNDPVKKTANKAAAGKDAVTVKTDQVKSDSAKKEPVAEKAKAPVKKAANKAAAGKDAVTVKTDQVKSDSAKKEPVAEKAKAPVKKSADKAEKTKGALAKKMEEVKSTAAVIGQKIADVAKDANEKSDTLEDRITSGLHEMKKDIHRIAVNIAEKTKV